jgi:CHAD domain-containing protein
VKDWEATLVAALKERWKKYRRALKRCQHKCSEKAVHASRVETRRLLSLIELLNVFLGQCHLKKTRRILKGHLDVFNPLRDTQVQLLLLEKRLRQFPETDSLHQVLIRREKRCLKTAARRIKHVKIRTLQKVLHRLARQLKQVQEDAGQRARHRAAIMTAVQDAYARTLRLQQAMDPGSAATIHRTRVAFKKFRYMVEALQPLLTEVTPERVAAMRDFQSMMGEVQDSKVFLARLDKHVQRNEARENARLLSPLAYGAPHRANHLLPQTRRRPARILAAQRRAGGRGSANAT